ncbi:cation efflux protein [Gautieria morchelliformis]|nr:cation efflux protein [Gautieria morchelliformis]
MPSRSTKISVLLAVDVVFFFVELIAGYAVGSLALVADSFHMLNDVMSLIVALYAIKLSKSEASPTYSYGWHRAEIVAALINGVFLLALCFSIFMEAIERFFSKPEISNAKLVVIVGTLGLASNFLGLFLFHEHSHPHPESSPRPQADQQIPTSSPISVLPVAVNTEEESPYPRRDSFTEMYGHPAATRASVVQAAHDIGYGSPTAHRGRISIDFDGSSVSSSAHEQARRSDGEQDRLQRPQNVLIDITEQSSLEPRNDNESPDVVQGSEDVRNTHEQVHTKGAHGSSHGSMNMRALILHVVGDALGNVGVIATGLIIWLSTWEYKYYFDPIISLVITVIIFSSALPLVRSASFILLQAVPSTISLEGIREDIQDVGGVLSVHELHVWQLSEDKIVASVHVWVARDREYMHIAHAIRKILHDHGVHSSTIQPEFHSAENTPPEDAIASRCLIPCPPNEVCKPENACCPPMKPPTPPLVDV